ncbi:cupin domain-containing protein [Roseomonas sp. BN140053]|uniref:cupin domain-containing protein n=1 Tax=Roseomonas sp. BN140053 TaxID=3391898 RepID=UPI0039E7E5FD
MPHATEGKARVPEAGPIEAGVTEAGSGEVLDVFGGSMVVKADPTRHGLFLGEHVVPPGYAVPPHVHAGDDELFFVLDGELTLLGAAVERRVGPGDTVQLPGGSRHGFRNDTAAAVRFLVMARPGLQTAEMFRHFDRAGRAAPGGLTPPEIIAICAQYGVEMG